jgi:V8-like Glu-specific endopeptidase
VTGASWNEGGAARNATGKVFFTMDNKNYVCSGAVVNDDGKAESLVLTAGHCVYDETNREFAKNWMFIPNYDDPAHRGCNYDTSGCYSAHAGDLYVHPQYASAGGFNSQAIKHDWAFARVSDGGPSLDSRVAAFPIKFDAPDVPRYAFGYPAASPYSGSDLVYCAGGVISDRGMGGDTWGMRCDMTPGSSGGPWMKGFSGASGTLNSVNSYKYNGGKYRNYMFGPKFSIETQRVFSAARREGGLAEVND